MKSAAVPSSVEFVSSSKKLLPKVVVLQVTAELLLSFSPGEFSCVCWQCCTVLFYLEPSQLTRCKKPAKTNHVE